MIATVKVLGAALMLAASLSASAADAGERGARLIQEARQVIVEIDKGQYEKVEARFDTTMADALPLDKLTTTSKTVFEQAGALKSIGKATTSQKQEFFVIVLPCEFANMPMDAQVVFDTDDKIAGMHFGPRITPTT
jgi:Protein of unknown function (DUF3887)